MFSRALFVVVFLASVALTAEIPRPEHPRPDLQRDTWLNLNGQWEFAESDTADEARFLAGEPYPDEIRVPFSRETEASGINRQELVEHVWYRRTFTLPESWNAPRARLHIGASDWFTEVWLNGVRVGNHTGGQASFSFEVTDVLKREDNVLTIHVRDETARGHQVLGKQSRTGAPHGIFFTPTTGIWQSVWLEGMGATFIDGISITTEPGQGAVLCEVTLDGSTEGLGLEVTAMDGPAIAGRGGARQARRDNRVIIALRSSKLWSPDDPHLYDLTFRVIRDETIVDTVHSYVGLRDIEDTGNAILLNDKPVFQRLVLDQGFYPRGGWTAETDALIKEDIERAKAAGFNGARLHQKVFDPRYLYWADKLGFLVWAEYPSYGADYDKPEVAFPVLAEWREVVARDRNHPAIVGWCPFNETPPEAVSLQQAVFALTKDLDPTRPVIEASGWEHSLASPEVLDAHDYEQEPARFSARWNNVFSRGEVVLPAPWQQLPRVGVPYFVSEYGTAFWGGDDPKHLAPDAFLERFSGLSTALLDNPAHFGFCFTELYDIAHERCGIYTFDREPKIDVAKVREVVAREAAYERAPLMRVPDASKHSWEVLLDGGLGAAEVDVRYLTETPPDTWLDATFDDAPWKVGAFPFGARLLRPREDARTLWAGSDLYGRTSFAWSGEPFDVAALVARWDDNTEVWLNGKPIWQGGFWTNQYSPFDVTGAVRDALVEGENVLSFHVHQRGGDQFIDLALMLGAVKTP